MLSETELAGDTCTAIAIGEAPWCCPACHGSLVAGADSLSCQGCVKTFPVFADIPDLRLAGPAWIDFAQDRARAVITEAHIREFGLESAIVQVFRHSRHFSDEKSAYRARQVIAGVDKCSAQIQTWMTPLLVSPALEIGCGAGQLLAACARRGIAIAGVDISLEWLVIAKHLARANGRPVHLAAAMAEKLPVRSGSTCSVLSLDVIEHVGSQKAYCDEIARILTREGNFGISTPNRFSFSPEPHVGVWGVGYLPIRLQQGWVKLVSDQDYRFTRLLSCKEALSLFAPHPEISVEVVFPAISDEDIALFPELKAFLARQYNRLCTSTMLRFALPFFGAYYRLIGRKM